MKKTICALLVFILIISALPSFAQDNDTFYIGEALSYASAAQEYPNAVTAFVRAVEKNDPTVDLTEYKIPTDKCRDFMQEIFDKEPTIFNISKHYSYYTSNDKSYITKIVPTYVMNAQEYKSAITAVKNKTSEMLSSTDASMSDFEKALILHDEIVKNYHYDTDFKNTDIYSLIRDGKGVCQAYALLYKYLLDKCGIENDISVSTEISHEWNTVKINGNWYNVDVTWDDPLFSNQVHDIAGIVKHKHFMCSDALSVAQGHLSPISNQSCNDKKYDNMNYREISSPFVYKDGVFYCFKTKTGIVSYSSTNDSFTPVYYDEITWGVWDMPGYYYTDNYTGLGVYGDYLIYATPTIIRAYSLQNKKSKDIYYPDVKNGYVYGMLLQGDTVTYGISKGGEGASLTEYTYDISFLRKTPAAGTPFTDIKESDWYYSSVKYVYENNLMSGMEQDTFAPNVTTSRAMLVKVLYNMEGKPATPNATNPFNDIAQNQWFTDAVIWAYSNGIVAGTSQTTFSPNDIITREQFAAILFRYAKFKNADTSSVTDVSAFTDFDGTSAYAKSAMIWANANGYISGMSQSTLSPKGKATRAQMAAILMRYLINQNI